MEKKKKGEENIQERQEILENVQLLIAYAKVYDTDAYNQIIQKTFNSNFSMYFNKPPRGGTYSSGSLDDKR